MNLQVWNEGIKVHGNKCWICSKGGKITSHHTLPKYLQPHKNVEVPLCKDCHDRLHGSDTNILTAFAYKIMKNTHSSFRKTCELIGLLKKKKPKDEDPPTGTNT